MEKNPQTERPLPSSIITFRFSDIQGSTPLLEHDPDTVIEDLLKELPKWAGGKRTWLPTTRIGLLIGQMLVKERDGRFCVSFATGNLK